ASNPLWPRCYRPVAEPSRRRRGLGPVLQAHALDTRTREFPMRFFSRFAKGEMRLGRIEAFSDGAFAIVVTLLVLELKVPVLKDHASTRELVHALAEHVPKFLSWLISFIIVAKFWLNHHHLLGLARHSDYALIWMNALFLLLQSFIPFPTALMGEY